MQKIRQSIINKLKLLKSNRKDLLKMLYPSSAKGYNEGYQNFLQEVLRNKSVLQDVICSNGMDRESLDITYTDKEQLLSFANKLPDGCHFEVHNIDDDCGSSFVLQPYYYRKETDLEYSERLGKLIRDLEMYLYEREFPVKRSGIP